MEIASNIEVWEIGRIKPYDSNAMVHGLGQVQELAESINRFGFNIPLAVQEDGTLIAGHGRLEAAIMLGLEAVPVVVLGHLSENEARAYRIADNRIARNSTFDMRALEMELAGLLENDVDISGIGFTAGELEGLLAGEPILPEPSAGGYWEGVNYATSDLAGQGRPAPRQVDGELEQISYSQKNKEIDIDSMPSEMVLKLKYSEADYWRVKEGLSLIASNEADAVIKLLGL